MASNDLFFDDSDVINFPTSDLNQNENEFWDRTQNELEQLERDFPDSLNINDNMTNGIGALPSATINDFISTPPNENNIENEDKLSDKSQSSKYSAIAKADHVYKEPEKIKAWREKQQEMLEAKDKEEQIKQKEMKEAAKKELEEWEQRYKEQITKAKENNRLHEEELADNRESYDPEKAWENVAALCDFNPKNSKHTKDVTRLRSIILKLKSHPIGVEVRGGATAGSKNKSSNRKNTTGTNIPNGHLEEDGGDST